MLSLKQTSRQMPLRQCVQNLVLVWAVILAVGCATNTANSEQQGALTDDVDYLTQLGLVRGHLYVGYRLYQAGHKEHAKTHMKHPESELYAELLPAFSARGSKGFADELAALASAVEEEQSNAAVDKVYAQLQAAITSSESYLASAELSPETKLAVVVNLLTIAADEYAIAVVDGRMENAHEYQDALGFTTIAKGIVESLDDCANNRDLILEELDSLNNLWPSLVPPMRLDTSANTLYSVAERIETLGRTISSK